ncbi:helix-turn-helix domain-containing protein [Streptomyces sp. NPDC058469]|uniref:AlbA family DNA-binding domain-containing protein n=1 Tax=Streptomyces sp. NPDC058469 TaxID=3346514 RepID=UPI003661CC02
MGARVQLDEVVRSISEDDRDAYVRLLALRQGKCWVLHDCWVLVGAEPPGWVETEWMYERYAFVAGRVAAADLALLYSDSACNAMTVGSLSVWSPGAASTVTVERRPGYSRLDRPQLTFPVVEYALSPFDQTDRQLPHMMLVGAGGAPSFPEPDSAWRAFFEGDFSLAGRSSPSSDLAKVRIADRAAWIAGVHITATELTVSVEGDAVQGTDLELYGVEERTVRRLDAAGPITIALANGLPTHAWLWLKRGTDWLDYRSIDPSSVWTNQAGRAGVEIDLPVDPVAAVEALIASGEGPRLEFKQMLPNRDARRTLKTVAAFAIGSGGSIVFGIDRDEVTITGIAEDKPSTQMRDELGNLLRAMVQPTPEFEIKEYRPDGKLILVLDVQPGQSPPYGLVTPGARDKPLEYFVRRGSNTYPAQPYELRSAVLRNGGTTEDFSTRRR